MASRTAMRILRVFTKDVTPVSMEIRVTNAVKQFRYGINLFSVYFSSLVLVNS